jgi:DNA primase
MGTALTEQQVGQLRSLASEFVLALDPDVAGQEATINSLITTWQAYEEGAAASTRRAIGLRHRRDVPVLKIAALPSGRDPDELIRGDQAEWMRLLEEAIPLMDFSIDHILPKMFNLDDAQGKSQAVEFMKSVILSYSPVGQDHYLQKLAQKLKVSVESVKTSIGDLRRRRPGRAGRRVAPEPGVDASGPALVSSPESSLEDYALAMLLQWPDLRERTADLPTELFERSEVRELFTRWLSCSTIDELRASLDDALHQLLDELMAKELVASDIPTTEAALDQSIRRLQKRQALREQENLLASEDPTLPPPREVEAPVSELNARIKQLSG